MTLLDELRSDPTKCNTISCCLLAICILLIMVLILVVHAPDAKKSGKKKGLIAWFEGLFHKKKSPSATKGNFMAYELSGQKVDVKTSPWDPQI